MRKLIALVTVMTALIFAGVGLLVWGLATKIHAPAAAMSDIVLPAQGRITAIAGYKDGLALHVSARDGEYIYLYDPQKGTPAGRIAVKREK
jgi:hypothetical protein